MRALILAAGYGERLRPLTDTTPKPLIEVGGRALIDHHLNALAAAGFQEVVVNTAHLAEQIHQFVGDGSRWGLRVRVSYEGRQPLETGGGMLQALALLGPSPFLAVNADIITDLDFGRLRNRSIDLAHLVMIPNPPDKPKGDFALDANGRISGRDDRGLTFSGIGLYRPELLSNCQPGRFSVVPVLEQAMAAGRVSGERHDGLWRDIGTPERLADARTTLGDQPATPG